VLELICEYETITVAEFFIYFILFINKQPMKVGQGLKRSLATQRLTQKKNGTHTHK